MTISAWTDYNQSYLTNALAQVRAALEKSQDTVADPPYSAGDQAAPAIEVLTRTFVLSRFERAILLLCAGMELDSTFAALCAKAQGDSARAYPTFSLALATLPEPHWSALAPYAPLRRWRLIDVIGGPAASLTGSPLRIDERILHYLTGIDSPDERLNGIIDSMDAEEPLPQSQREVATRVVEALSTTPGDNLAPIPHIFGVDEAARRAIAVDAFTTLRLQPMAIAASAIPAGTAEFELTLRLLEREAMLSARALYLDAESIGGSEVPTPVVRFLERCTGPLILSSRDRWAPMRRAVESIEVRKPTREEQSLLWQETLVGMPSASNAQVQQLISQFNLGAMAIRAAGRRAVHDDARGDPLAERLWNSGRAQARPRMDDLAQRIESTFEWDDLILPEHELRALNDIAVQVKHRATVYHDWGFAQKSSRGLGISALFAGASGTGKTMAAEVLSNALKLDLYRIDLSSVVSKYIGETEKNLRRVFDAGEDGGAILFFDEADALFGKRSEVKDSHDRYANTEINYLLQRMEAYGGLSILATNMKSALDGAFLRRIRFVVNFPLPDEAQRAAIWTKALPPSMPRDGVEIARLSRLPLTGGSIRNVALNAAFAAAGNGEPLRMSHLARAARSEYAKLERPLNETDLRDWQ